MNSEVSLPFSLTDEDYENSQFLTELDQTHEDGTPTHIILQYLIEMQVLADKIKSYMKNIGALI